MDGIPLCKPFDQDNVVGVVKFTDKDYEAYFTNALMEDVKFGIGAEIRHNEHTPRLVLLSFMPVPAVQLKRDTTVENQCDEWEYSHNGRRRCLLVDHHPDSHIYGPWE